MGLIEQLQQRLRTHDWGQREKTMDDLARVLGVSVQSIRRLVWAVDGSGKSGRKIDQDEIRALCAFFDVPYEQRIEVPIRGVVGAGYRLLANHDAGDLGTLELLVDAPDEMMALEVRGDSMLPVYREGDFLVCGQNRLEDRGISDLVGSECVVHTADDVIAVKILVDDRGGDSWNLLSYNAEPMWDVELKGVYEILFVKRGRKKAPRLIR